MKPAILVTFTVKTKKFSSRYEITKFFRTLYGWNQTVCHGEKRYKYKRDGLLDKIPHIRIDQSSFLIPERFFEEVEDFFSHWDDKVIFKTFKVLVEEEFKWLKRKRK